MGKLGLAFASAMLACLQACGGGGGGSSASTTPPVGTNPPGTVQPPVVAPGISLLAGSIGGIGNIDGEALSARFQGPYDMASDAAGNIYVADTPSHTIRKIAKDGLVTTLAGQTGVPGFADGTGANARFNNPAGIAVDASGTIYVIDSFNGSIRKLTSAGVVTTLVGSPDRRTGVDGDASVASLGSILSLAIDGAGNLYVPDSNAIRKVTPTGTVSTLAGKMRSSGFVDGVGTDARFSSLGGVAVDSVGNLFVGDDATLRKVTPTGEVTTIAGNRGQYVTRDGAGSAASFDGIYDLAVDKTGNVFAVEYGVVRKITPAGSVSTLAGVTRVNGWADGAGNAARFSLLRGIALDAADNLLIADTGNSAIRKVTQAGIVSTIAGKGLEKGWVDGAGSAARFNTPVFLVVDSAGNTFVSDFENRLVRKISPAGEVSTLAGNSQKALSADGTGSGASFSYVNGLAIDKAGNVFVADGPLIRKITTAGVVTTLSGTGSFLAVAGLAIDAGGNLLIADYDARVIRKIDPSGVVSVVAGKNEFNNTYADGAGAAARFSSPYGIGVDPSGNIYVSDLQNKVIRKITPDGVVSTLAGMRGVSGYTDGLGSIARFSSPQGLTVDASGNVFVTDGPTIRKISPSGMVSTVVGSPSSLGVRMGALPGSLSRPLGLVFDANGVLYASDEQAVIRVKF